jgi:hypothetical protein
MKLRESNEPRDCVQLFIDALVRLLSNVRTWLKNGGPLLRFVRNQRYQLPSKPVIGTPWLGLEAST